MKNSKSQQDFFKKFEQTVSLQQSKIEDLKEKAFDKFEKFVN